MSRPKIPIADQIERAGVAISNTRDSDDVATLVAEYGYTPDRLEEGRLLYQAALDAVGRKQMAAGEYRVQTAEAHAARAVARDARVALAQVARVCLDAGQRAALGLEGRTPHTIADFIQTGYTLFDNAQSVPEIQAVLARYGYDRARLDRERDKVAAFEAAYQRQVAARGNAQVATQAQDAALAALNAWASSYLRIARVALRGNKPLLEKIGITVRMTKTAAQRAAPAKAAATRAARKKVQT